MLFMMDVDWFNLSILILFSLTALIQIIYYLFIFSRFIFYKTIIKTNDQKPVSIVICARNEADNLANPELIWLGQQADQ